MQQVWYYNCRTLH